MVGETASGFLAFPACRGRRPGRGGPQDGLRGGGVRPRQPLAGVLLRRRRVLPGPREQAGDGWEAGRFDPLIGYRFDSFEWESVRVHDSRSQQNVETLYPVPES